MAKNGVTKLRLETAFFKHQKIGGCDQGSCIRSRSDLLKMRVCYYELLKVARNAQADEIKKAYRKQALIWHPGIRLLLGLILRPIAVVTDKTLQTRISIDFRKQQSILR